MAKVVSYNFCKCKCKLFAKHRARQNPCQKLRCLQKVLAKKLQARQKPGAKTSPVFGAVLGFGCAFLQKKLSANAGCEACFWNLGALFSKEVQRALTTCVWSRGRNLITLEFQKSWNSTAFPIFFLGSFMVRGWGFRLLEGLGKRGGKNEKKVTKAKRS